MTKGLTAFSLALLIAAAHAQVSGTVSAVTIRGNVNISREAILSAMALQQGKPYDSSKLLADKRAIEDLGLFKDVKVYSRPINDTDWEIQVEVAENPYIREIRVTGNTVYSAADILPLVTQPVNAVFNLRTVAPTVDAIAKLYEKRGYFAQADVSPLDVNASTLNVRIIERAVRDIKLTGLMRTRPSVVRRLMKTKPGAAFSEQLWAIDRRRLESTQWFESIEASSQPTDEIGKFDLLMDVKEMRTAQIGFGATLDPRSRLAGTLRWNDNNWNGLGQQLGIQLQQDTAGKGLSSSIDFANPFMDSKGSEMSFRLYSRVNSYFSGSGIGSSDSPNNEDFDERRTGAALSFAKPTGHDWIGSVGISGERIKTLNRRTTNLTSVDYIQQDGDVIGFQMQMARDRRDVPLDPAEGDYLRLTLEPYMTHITEIGGNVAANTEILGNHHFLRGTMEYKAFFSKRPKDPKKFADPRNVLAIRGRVSAISGVTPFFEQLFIGGSDSVRGYSDQRFWGKRSVLGSIELRHPLQKSFNLIGFFDVGGAWGGYGTLNKFSQSSDFKLHYGYGAGVGFRTPFGPIRIDFGINEKGGNRTHFSIGGNF